MVLQRRLSMVNVIIDAQLSLSSALDAISLVHIAINLLEVSLKDGTETCIIPSLRTMFRLYYTFTMVVFQNDLMTISRKHTVIYIASISQYYFLLFTNICRFSSLQSQFTGIYLLPRK